VDSGDDATGKGWGGAESRGDLERVMHFERCDGSMDVEMERHPRAGGDPAHGDRLDSRLRGNDQRARMMSASSPECIIRSREGSTSHDSTLEAPQRYVEALFGETFDWELFTAMISDTLQLPPRLPGSCETEAWVAAGHSPWHSCPSGAAA